MNTIENKKRLAKAVLVGLQLPGMNKNEVEGSLDELGRLVKTLGFEVVATLSQKRTSPNKGTIIGKGRLIELCQMTGGPGPTGTSDEDIYEDKEEDALQQGVASILANIVIFDCDIGPTQLMNLEKATGVEVLDRTGVILEIFSSHAKSRESRMQVELAKLAYLAPRLRVSRIGADRQGGGIGAKGAGETARELDKRRIRDRMAELRRNIDAINRDDANRRQHRQDILSVALVGYTNAGKSSLMRALTRSPVLVEDKLFATLGTTVRLLHPPSVPKVLISDTVGFIKNLPHGLVASFRSTLDEACSASLLLFTVDASDMNFREQITVTKEVLSSIDAGEIPSQLVLNKTDQIGPETLESLKQEFPDAILISTRNTEDVKAVREIVISSFEKDMEDRSFHIPFAKSNLLDSIREKLRVLQETHDYNGTCLKVRGKVTTLQWVEHQLASVKS